MPRTRQNWMTAACSSCSLIGRGRVPRRPEGIVALAEGGLRVAVHRVEEPVQLCLALPVITPGLVGGLPELRGHLVADVAVDLERLTEQGLAANRVRRETRHVHTQARQDQLAVRL